MQNVLLLRDAIDSTKYPNLSRFTRSNSISTEELLVILANSYELAADGQTNMIESYEEASLDQYVINNIQQINSLPPSVGQFYEYVTEALQLAEYGLTPFGNFAFQNAIHAEDTIDSFKNEVKEQMAAIDEKFRELPGIIEVAESDAWDATFDSIREMIDYNSFSRLASRSIVNDGQTKRSLFELDKTHAQSRFFDLTIQAMRFYVHTTRATLYDPTGRASLMPQREVW